MGVQSAGASELYVQQPNVLRFNGGQGQGGNRESCAELVAEQDPIRLGSGETEHARHIDLYQGDALCDAAWEFRAP